MMNTTTEIVEKNELKSRAAASKLSPFVRLYIYNFLSFQDTLRKIALVNKQERKNLRNSKIAYEGKRRSFSLGGPNFYGIECMGHKDFKSSLS